MALTEVYPEKTAEQIITELLCAALDEIEEDFPYVQGTRIISYDECNNAIYEDVGITPRFITLINKYLEK